MQQLTAKGSSSVLVVGRLIGAHAALTRELSAQLVADHGLTLSEYEVLMLLASAPDGVTRMLDRLEASGLVGKASCEKDARVTYAQLTEAGVAKLEECAPGHVAAAERFLGERFDEHELTSLVELLGRLSAPADDECGLE